MFGHKRRTIERLERRIKNIEKATFRKPSIPFPTFWFPEDTEVILSRETPLEQRLDQLVKALDLTWVPETKATTGGYYESKMND